MLHADDASTLFQQTFGRTPAAVARAPGRVNLIGEHTDYNDGFVLPIAIEQCTWAAVAPRDDGEARVVSRELGPGANWHLGAWPKDRAHDWTSYVAGVAELLLKRGARLPGFELLIASDVPPGAGLSSSAALEVSCALALAGLAGEPLETIELIDLCRAAEHQYAGVPCGLMDQTASLLGREGCALLIDCRTRKVQPIPLPDADCEWIVIDSGVRHALAAGEYAKRQRECQAALQYFQRVQPGIRALRDVSSAMVRAHALQLDPTAAARALHVCTENERTLTAADALRRSDVETVGELLRGSHVSLRDDYEVSCAELDRIVEAVTGVAGVYGARMTGGGFGGCVIVLARSEAAGEITAALGKKLPANDLAKTRQFVVRPGAGAELVRLEGG